MGTDSVTGSSLFAERLPAQTPEQALASVAVLGLGYVGLPTGIGLAEQGMRVIGVDVSERRLQDMREGSVDLAAGRRERLQSASSSDELALTSTPVRSQAADAVVICVPDAGRRVASSPTCGFCAPPARRSVAQARRDQVIVLTSTTYVGHHAASC